MKFSNHKIPIILILIIFLISCKSKSVISKNNYKQFKITFFKNELKDAKSNYKFSAIVDSSGKKVNYYFQNDEVWKKENNSGKQIHRLLFTKPKDFFDVIPLTEIEKYILIEADKINNSLNLCKLKNFNRGIGFINEIE